MDVEDKTDDRCQAAIAWLPLFIDICTQLDFSRALRFERSKVIIIVISGETPKAAVHHHFHYPLINRHSA